MTIGTGVAEVPSCDIEGVVVERIQANYHCRYGTHGDVPDLDRVPVLYEIQSHLHEPLVARSPSNLLVIFNFKLPRRSHPHH